MKTIDLLPVSSIFFCFVHFISCTVLVQDFFPFGVDKGDSLAPRVDDGFAGPIGLRHGFPFFNNTYNSVFVSTNGAVSFRMGVTQYTPTCGAMGRDSTMIAPFWADIDIQNGGTIYYRESTDPAVLLKASREIQSAFPNLWGVSLGTAFIATFDAVSFYGQCNSGSVTNTFQLILTSDGTRSFAIFYYGNIMWTTGTASGGQCSTGLGGNPAKAGFDVGDEQTFFEIPGTCTSNIVNIDESSNVNQPGKWIFRVDGSLESADCNEDVSANLRINPSFITLFGHQPITIQGPCLNLAESVSCRFNDPRQPSLIVPGEILEDRSGAICNVPYLYSYGRLTVELIVNNPNAQQIYSGYLYTTEPRVDFEINITSASQQWSFSLSWNPDFFLNENEPLELVLLEFTDNVWVERTVLLSGITNNGILETHRVSGFPVTSFVTFTLRPSLWTIRSKWGFSTLMCAEHLVPYWDNDAACEKWYAQDPGPPTDVQPCPPLLQQALEDERFERDTNLEANLGYFHPEAEAAFRQRTANPTKSGQQCIYKSGQILFGPPSGGSADMCSPTVSLFDHWRDDVVPWCQCCKHSYEDYSCRYYYEKRPSSSGNGYVPPDTGRGNGDPHITTLDSTSYTFNGVGEFWMLKTLDNSFSMQARMEPFTGESGSPTASIFTAFVLSDGETVLQLQVTTSGLTVLINGEPVALSEDSLQGQSLYLGKATLSKSGDKLTVTFAAGFSFTFLQNGESLGVIASATDKNLEKVNGLLGFFDGNPENDLSPPDGSPAVPTTATLRQIHEEFGLKWIITAEESLFTYPEGKSYLYYFNPTFEPTFSLPDISQLPEHVVTACGNSTDCLFDYYSTGSLEFAVRTREFQQTFEEHVKIVNEEIQLCDQIFPVENGYFGADNFLVGSTVTFHCNVGFVLVGKEVITCETVSNGGLAWSDQIPFCAPELNCQDQPGHSSYHRDVLDCTKYYVCEGTRKHHMPCPPPLVFNPDLNVCDWRANVPVCN